MGSGASGMDRAGWATVILVAVVTAIAAWSTIETGPTTAPTAPRTFGASDISGALSTVFHPGVILGAASNETDTLLAGIGVYVVSPEFSLPVLGDLRPGPDGPTVRNLTPLVNPYFFEGGTYALGWNGSQWLVAGQATWGGINYGTLVSLQGGTLTNLTSLILPYFAGGGIFAIGWNGTAWLIGGNSSSSITLVALEGDHVTNLTKLVPDRDPLGWVQLIAWNGAEWLLGGEKVFGTLKGNTYHDLIPASPFGDSGVYAGGWNGTAWVAGGGAGDVVVVRGDEVLPGPVLPASFDQSALLITSYSAGWLIGGKGTASGGGFAPGLVSWDGTPGAAGVTDLSSVVPDSFHGGEIQGGGWVPAFGPAELALVGEGSYDNDSGYGLGAIALLTVP